jgi:hypothetical protein
MTITTVPEKSPKYEVSGNEGEKTSEHPFSFVPPSYEDYTTSVAKPYSNKKFVSQRNIGLYTQKQEFKNSLTSHVPK